MPSTPATRLSAVIVTHDSGAAVASALPALVAQLTADDTLDGVARVMPARGRGWSANVRALEAGCSSAR
jgi:hypothetical protein